MINFARLISFITIILFGLVCFADDPNKANDINQIIDSDAGNVTKEDISNGNADQNNQYHDIMQITDKDIVLGNKEAPIKIVEYSAFTCPSCASFYTTVWPKIKSDFVDTGKVLYIGRFFSPYKSDMQGVRIVRCTYAAHGEDAYSKLKLTLFQQQRNWAFSKNSENILANITMLAGVSSNRYKACMNDEDEMRYIIGATKEIYSKPGFPGTPFFIVNGKSFSGYFGDLYQEIERLLNSL